MTEPTTEIRKLRAHHIFRLGHILNIDNAWKKVMAVIPEHPKKLNYNSIYKHDSVR